MGFPSFPDRTDEELYGLAHQTLQSWSALEQYPIDIDHYLEKYENIKVFPDPSMAKLCDSGGATSRDKSTIYVDWNDYHEPRQQYRLRLTIAHEFAHAKLHSSIHSYVKSEADMKQLLTHFMENPKVYGMYEVQAFMLAGYLLVPDQTLLPVTKEVVKEMRVKSPLDMSSEVVWKIIAKEVAKKYEVTPKVTERRLQYSKMWQKPLACP